MSTWFVTDKGKTITCAETGRMLWRHGKTWHAETEDHAAYEVRDDYALPMLTALGYEWRGGRIQPITAPVSAHPAPAGALVLVPVDLSKPAEKGVYLVYHAARRGWQDWDMVDGEKWGVGMNAQITRAYILPKVAQ